MTYPQDSDYEDKIIEKVEKQRDGTFAITCDGWGIHVGEFTGKPREGMTARFYPKDNIGRPVRGLFIDGVKAWYRTEAEDKEYRDIQLYGADAADWLKRWDDGRGVWSIEMGGLGPGYEQCIQITAAEVLRFILGQKYDVALWDDKDIWKQNLEAIEKHGFANERVKELGLSGAQWGAAVNLACQIYRKGPRGLMSDGRVKDRHIQVSRTFPGMAA